MRWTTDPYLSDINFFRTLTVVPIKPLLSVASHEPPVDDRAKHRQMLHLEHLRFDGEGELGATATSVAQKKNAAGAELRADVRESVHDMKIGSAYKTSYSSASLIATVRAATSLSVFSVRYVRARSTKSGAACLVFAAFTSGPWSSAQS